jgi:hypothetical protein
MALISATSEPVLLALPRIAQQRDAIHPTSANQRTLARIVPRHPSDLAILATVKGRQTDGLRRWFIQLGDKMTYITDSSRLRGSGSPERRSFLRQHQTGMHDNCASIEPHRQEGLTTTCFKSLCWRCLLVSFIDAIMASLLISSSPCDKTLHVFGIFFSCVRSVSTAFIPLSDGMSGERRLLPSRNIPLRRDIVEPAADGADVLNTPS